MTITTLYDRIVIRPIENPPVSVGGIIITVGEVDKSHKGKVLIVGIGKKLKNNTILPLDVKVGDTVLYDTKAGATVKIDGEELTVLTENDIYAVLEE